MQFIRIPALVISVLVSILSAYLTFIFMSSLGESSGMSGTYGATGLLLDAAKCLLPFGVIAAFKKGHEIQAIVLAALAASLILVSFYSSVSAFDTGISQQAENTREYKAINDKIARLENMAYEVRDEASKLPHNFNKARRIELEKARNIDREINDLIDHRATITVNTNSSKYLYEISIIASISLEVISVAMAMILSLTSSGQARTKGESTKETVIDERNNLRNEIRLSVKSGQAHPSIRGVREYFSGIGNDAISMILKELGAEGVLRPKGRGWELV